MSISEIFLEYAADIKVIFIGGVVLGYVFYRVMTIIHRRKLKALRDSNKSTNNMVRKIKICTVLFTKN